MAQAFEIREDKARQRPEADFGNAKRSTKTELCRVFFFGLKHISLT